LIDSPFTAADFEREMLWMMEDKARYREMRHAARTYSTSRFTFEAAAQEIVRCVQEAFSC
jgi:hypothetical protein